jgi:hypothetical protein
MRLVAVTLAALALLLATVTPVAAWSPSAHAIHYYTFTAAPLDGWTTYTTTQDTCEHAATTTLIMANRDGWPVDLISATAIDMAHTLPAASPCRVTLGLR